MDPLIEFGAGGADQPEIAQTIAEAMRAFGQAAHALAAQLAEAWRQLTAALAEICVPIVRWVQRWAQRHWRTIRQALGPSYRPPSIMRKKLRRYARTIGHVDRC